MKFLRRLLLALVVWSGFVAAWIVVGPEERSDGTADVALVLGAAISGAKPSPVFRERINHGVTLYKQGRVKKLLFTGGIGAAESIAEAEVAKNYALGLGVPGQDILIETRSRTTQQNLVEAMAVMNKGQAKTALIVSDPLHLRRAMIMAGDLGVDAEAGATPSTRYRSLSTQLPFLLREIYFIHHYWLFGQ